MRRFMKLSDLVVPKTAGGQPTLYLGLSGVIHPSESTYELVMNRSPWADGHVEYEGVAVLAEALENWPAVRIVLTSTLPAAHGLPAVLERLGVELSRRVAGFTFEDLTTRVSRHVRTRGGAAKDVGISSEDYWRMSKADIVAVHVAWSRPAQWVVIDDEDILWSPDVRANKLVLTDGCVGLQGEPSQRRLMAVLEQNFGRSS